jgi:2-keto-4-pentenoate hydratase
MSASKQEAPSGSTTGLEAGGIGTIVRALEQAERARVPTAPLTDTYPGIGTEGAYAIQSAWLARKLATGQELVGRKIGLTSKAMQQQLGVTEPDFGSLLRSMLLDSGGSLRRSDLIQPRVEPEIAFWLDGDLRGPGVTRDAVLRVTRAVSPALEVVDSRIADWKIKLVDTISDNGSSARAVIGPEVRLGSLDLAAEPVRLLRNGELVGRGTGAAVLGHPAEAVAWVANTLARFGDALLPGQVVLPGAMCASVFANAGDTFTAEFGELGSVTVRFE